MSKKWFSSPREEALEIAHNTRKNLLAGNEDAVSILRACLVIANNLNKNDDMKWIQQELFGYPDLKVPACRIVACKYEIKGVEQTGFYNISLFHPAHTFVQYASTELGMVVEVNDKVVFVTVPRIKILLAGITDRCLIFLNRVITELQYGGVVEYLMEEIRHKTDEKLANLDSKITEETQSLYLNLTSTNPADWTKVGHSCRKILKLLADKVFPPSDEKFTAKDGRVFEVSDSHFINRLYAFLDQKVSGDERKFLTAEIEYLESYLRQVVDYAQMVEHNPSIEKFHANMLAIHTYLIISEILRHIS